MHRVDLVVPGLSNLPVHEFSAEAIDSASPSLQKLFQFAAVSRSEQQDIDDTLAACLGLESPRLAYASAIESSAEGAGLLFKPVFLKADINNAIVFPVTDHLDELNILINDLSDFFKEDCSIKALPDGAWLMGLHQCSPLTGTPHYLSAMGKKITHYLEQASNQLEWFKLINEMQMFLYQHEVNQARAASGRPTINSLWCWGADPYQGEHFKDVRWYSDDWLMQRVGQPYCDSASAAEQLAVDGIEGRTIIVNLSVLKALKGEGADDVLELLQVLEQRYLAPIFDNKSCELRLHSSAEDTLIYRPSMRWKFWRRKQRGWFQ